MSLGAGADSYGYYSVAIGADAVAGGDSSIYDSNIAIGANAAAYGLSSIAIGNDATTFQYNSIAIGNFAFATRYNGIAIGNSTETDTSSIAIGTGAKATGRSSVAIGPNATAFSDFTIRLGSLATVEIGGYEPWTNISDGRFKKSVKEDIPGLEFITALRPVSYVLDKEALAKSRDETYTRKSIERETGFIAQEVEEAANALSFEFSGLKTPDSEEDHYALAYAQFVVPLVKAVQEQQDQIDSLKNENDELRSRLNRIEAMLTAGGLNEAEKNVVGNAIKQK